MTISTESVFLEKARATASGSAYGGRLILDDVQLITTGGLLEEANCHVTVRQLVDAIENGLLYTDQEMQRGINPVASPRPSVELAVRAGYPDSTQYKFNERNADQMAEKLLEGEPLYITPLIWNMRPGAFEAFYDEGAHQLLFYSGRIYLPDSHHRHQALLKAFRTKAEAPDEYPAFDPERSLSLNIRFMTREQEGEFFYQKNQLPTPVQKSKAYDLTTEDSLALLTKRVIEQSDALLRNVNRVTDTLTARNPQVVTLSTLRSVIERAVGLETVAPERVAELSAHLAVFYDLLATARPELGVLDLGARQGVRTTLLVDAAVMFHGYGRLMHEFLKDLETSTLAETRSSWGMRLAILAAGEEYRYAKKAKAWAGDFFSRANPLWFEVGVLQPTKSGGVAVSNTRQTRAQCERVLLDRVKTN